MTVATSTLLGRPLWFELMTTDMKGAETFYRDIVGWKTAPYENARHPYTIFNRAESVGIGGVMTRPPEVKAPPFWAMYIGAPKLEEVASHILRLGGKAHTEVLDLPNVGRAQLMMDPQGAAFYIFEPSSEERRPETAPEIGDASWLELMTTDLNGAIRFYEQVFGWEPTESMDMGPMGKYQMFNRPHGMIGGMMNKPPEMANAPSNWQIYFRVSDVHAAAERVKAKGGKVLNGPTEVPGGDWIVNATDPQGAAFGLHSTKA